jgi:hypothetical protein
MASARSMAARHIGQSGIGLFRHVMGLSGA